MTVRPTLREWALAHRNPLLVAAVLLLIVGAVLANSLPKAEARRVTQIAEIGRTEGFKKLGRGRLFSRQEAP